MRERPDDEKTPRVRLNRAALRAVALASVAISLALVAALLAQGGLFSGNPGSPEHPDGLTTLALILAILAFLIQILVFVLQTNSANAAVRRSEELNSQTHSVLGKIEASSSATQKVLISQFERLLDYVVGNRGHSPPPVDVAATDDEDEDAEATDDGEPLTESSVRRVVSEVLRSAERPTFEVEAPRPSREDKEVIQYLRTWPSEAEARAAVEVLTQLPPLALALLTRFATYELTQRSRGDEVGLIRSVNPTPSLAVLEDQGLVKDVGDRFRLTEKGKELARMLPIGKRRGKKPPWADEAIAPLLQSPR